MKVRAWRVGSGLLWALAHRACGLCSLHPGLDLRGGLFAAPTLTFLRHPSSYPLTSPALPRGAQRLGAAQRWKGWKWTPSATLEGALFFANATVNKIALGMTRGPGGAGGVWVVCGHPEKRVWGWSLILRACSATPTACSLQSLGARQRAAPVPLSPVLPGCHTLLSFFLGKSRSPFTLE